MSMHIGSKGSSGRPRNLWPINPTQQLIRRSSPRLRPLWTSLEVAKEQQ